MCIAEVADRRRKDSTGNRQFPNNFRHIFRNVGRKSGLDNVSGLTWFLNDEANGKKSKVRIPASYQQGS